MSRSVSAPSSVTKTSPCWNGFIVPGSTLRYGSSFCIVTRRPRALSSRPRLDAVNPLPRLDATPPVTKTCRTGLSGALAERANPVSRGHCARPPSGGIARSTGVHGNTCSAVGPLVVRTRWRVVSEHTLTRPLGRAEVEIDLRETVHHLLNRWPCRRLLSPRDAQPCSPRLIAQGALGPVGQSPGVAGADQHRRLPHEIADAAHIGGDKGNSRPQRLLRHQRSRLPVAGEDH